MKSPGDKQKTPSEASKARKKIALKEGWDKKTLSKLKAKKIDGGGYGFSYKDLK